MKLKADRAAVPYSYLIDNVKVLLIFLVVFNHIIAFNLVKVDIVVRYIWYAITIFHMPAFIFISGYLSKKPQNVMKNVKNLLIPYILGYSLTWYSQIWLGRSDICGKVNISQQCAASDKNGCLFLFRQSFCGQYPII